jgi:hypothetical protein
MATCTFNDNFSAATTGSAWQLATGTGGNPGTWVQSGGVYAQTNILGQYGDPKKAIIANAGLDPTADYTITAKVRVDSWVAGDYARAGVSLFSNTTNGHGLNLLFHSAVGNQNTIEFLDDQLAWGNSYAFTWTIGTWYWFKLTSNAGTLYGKVWADGDSEPGTYPYTWTRSGRTGYPALTGGSSNAGGNSTVSFDDVSVVCLNPPATDSPVILSRNGGSPTILSPLGTSNSSAIIR